MHSAPNFAADSEAVIRFAFWSGMGALALALLLLVSITLLRFRHWRNERRRQEFLSVWPGLLNESVLSRAVQGQLPPIAERDAALFLSYWNHLQNSLRGEAREQLNFLARAAGMDRAARRLLKGGNSAEKLLAIASLGHLGEKADVEMLKRLLQSHRPMTSFLAARAILQIDPALLGDLMPVIVRRGDLATVAVANILKEIGADAVSPVLAEMLRDALRQGAGSQYMTRLIALTVAAHRAVVHQPLREILDEAENADVLAGCLKAMRDPQDLDRLRQLIGHPDWRVRVQAASALGDIGEEEDLEPLTNLLSDPNWWVRYRAAQAMSRLPFVTIGDLEEMKKRLDDRFAVDMLNHVISERMS